MIDLFIVILWLLPDNAGYIIALIDALMVILSVVDKADLYQLLSTR